MRTKRKRENKMHAATSREYLRIHHTYTVEELVNFGYSKRRAQQIVNSGDNWIAANGGERKPLDIAHSAERGAR
jgi:hypothetical protein